MFLTPFVVVGCNLIITAVLNLVGQTKVVIDRSESYVSTGLSFVAWKSRFNPTEVKSIKYNGEKNVIEISSIKNARFGSLLREDQREWFIVILKEILLNSKNRKHGDKLQYLSWLKN